MQLRENAEQYSGLKPRSEANQGGGLKWRSCLGSLNWRRDDHESVVCYALYFAVFVADFSLLSLAFPLSLLCYALLAQPPSRRFWQAWFPHPSVPCCYVMSHVGSLCKVYPGNCDGLWECDGGVLHVP